MALLRSADRLLVVVAVVIDDAAIVIGERIVRIDLERLVVVV